MPGLTEPLFPSHAFTSARTPPNGARSPRRPNDYIGSPAAGMDASRVPPWGLSCSPAGRLKRDSDVLLLAHLVVKDSFITLPPIHVPFPVHAALFELDLLPGI